MKKTIILAAAALAAVACNLNRYPISEVAADAYVKDEVLKMEYDVLNKFPKWRPMLTSRMPKASKTLS